MRGGTARLGGGKACHGLSILAITVGLIVSACAAQPAPGASPGPSGPAATANAKATEGQFELDFSLRTTSWSASEPIEGTASLSVATAVEVSGSGEGILGFNYDEVGGLGRHIEWVETADCRPYQIQPGEPLTSGLKKAGGYEPGASGADFLASFFADPVVHLPAGTWTITALASFVSQGCQLPSHELSAPITIDVTP
jgi:hypothetical protein